MDQIVMSLRPTLAILASRLAGQKTAPARLSHAIRRRTGAEPWLVLQSSELDSLISEKLPPVAEQLDNLLSYFELMVGDDHFGAVEVIEPEFLAGIVGAVDGEAVDVLLSQATKRGLIVYEPDDHYALTPDGWHELEKTRREQKSSMSKGTKVFIGHGRSGDWRDLKDFLVDRLGLKYDEFNRESAAGVSTSARLEEMLNNAAFAFLVMTAEDETSEGQKQARMNVIHEVGLFQGKLGFRKAIVLLEHGCEEFSNIVGLGQIRFEAGRLRDKSDEIRQVLEREGIILA
ncbi:TIR domain-containing protein [Agrobacterium vitis]|uniref:TIR domain-containing protein n=1 Tax=Agrobacterium vitis TaxID=373 RepID=UPI001F2E8917|nr:TIR domain-containing protein [Agrobacterium vitis]